VGRVNRFAAAVERTPLRVGSIARSMALFGGATAVGQAATLVAAPILARLYNPEAFGLLSVFSAALVVGITISSLRFDFAIPIANDDQESMHLLVVSVLVALGISGGVGVAILLWGTGITAAVGAPALAPFLWLLPVGIMAASTNQALTAWAVSQKLYGTLARVRLFQSLVMITSQVGLGVLAIGAGGLLVGDTLGRSLGTTNLLRTFARRLRQTPVSLAAVRQAARAHWGFARIMTAASLVNALTLQLPFLLIPFAFGLALSGQYFLASRMLILPAGLVSSAVYQVFLGETSSRRASPDELRSLVYRTAVSLFAFSIPTYTIAAVAAPAAVSTFFGEEWALAGLYAQILAPSLILKTVTSPISSLLLVGRRERESLAFTMLELVLKGGVLVVGVLLQSLTLGVVLLTVVTIGLSVGSLWRFLRVASISLADIARPALRTLLVTVPALSGTIVVVVAAPGVTLPAAAIGWAAALAMTVRVARRPPPLRATGA
jgi:O-antigen/teichoic acid export membrane protein